MSTVARVRPDKGAHYYWPDGKPCYEVIGSTTKRPRPTNITDARNLGLLVSPTTVINSILEKTELDYWKQEQACLAVLTAPRREGEGLDDFVKRVLQDEKQQDEEAKNASQLGKDIHEAMVQLSNGGQVTEAILPYVAHAWEYVRSRVARKVIKTEFTVIGEGYAGMVDMMGHSPAEGAFAVVDYKSCRTMPKNGSYFGHRLQLSAYARALAHHNIAPMEAILTYNVYISTREVGHFKVFLNPSWPTDYTCGFLPLYTIWCHMNNHWPNKIKSQ